MQCKVLRVEGAAAEWSVTVQILEGDSKDECVHGLKWWHLVYTGQKFRRNGPFSDLLTIGSSMPHLLKRCCPLS